MSINITKRTSTNNTSYTPSRDIKYIVIHYTAGSTSRAGTASNTASMFSQYGLNASADFIVDDSTIVQFNPDLYNRSCWHCGDGKAGTRGGSYYGRCTNFNSIGIEICSTNPNWSASDWANSTKWSFTNAVVNRAIELTKYLMKEFNIPASNVIRHYDVSGKLCVPLDSSEVLTPEGWKLIKDLDEEKDTIAMFDTKTDELSFTNFTTIEPYEAEVLKQRNFEATADHRMWIKPNSKNSHTFRESTWGEVLEGSKQSVIKTAGYLKGAEGLPLSDDELRLLVWIQGDGHYMKEKGSSTNHIYGVEWHLKKERKIQRLTALLDDLAIDFTNHPKADGTTSIRVYTDELYRFAEKYLTNKHFTTDFINMTQHQFNIFWEELLQVDGCKTASSFCSKYQNELDIVQAICATHGARTNLCQTGSSPALIRTYSNYTVTGDARASSPAQKRTTMVGCVTVPTGYILLRQKGKTFIVGNCPGIIGWNADSGDESKWKAFKSKISNTTTNTSTKKEVGKGSTEVIYRIRLSANDAKTQKGAYKNLQSAKALADKYAAEGYKVYDSNGKLIYTPVTSTAKTTKYLVEITADVLNVRAGAGTNYKINTTVRKGEVYTIVAEKNGWGLLKAFQKNQDGWISLNYTKKR